MAFGDSGVVFNAVTALTGSHGSGLAGKGKIFRQQLEDPPAEVPKERDELDGFVIVTRLGRRGVHLGLLVGISITRRKAELEVGSSQLRWQTKIDLSQDKFSRWNNKKKVRKCKVVGACRSGDVAFHFIFDAGIAAAGDMIIVVY